jgi:hypothetical protein
VVGKVNTHGDLLRISPLNQSAILKAVPLNVGSSALTTGGSHTIRNA